MVLPVRYKALQQIWSPEQGAIRRSDSTNSNMISSSCSRVFSIEHELLTAEPAEPCLLEQDVVVVNKLLPCFGGMNIYFHNARVRRNSKFGEPVVAGRFIAFNDYLQVQLCCCRF